MTTITRHLTRVSARWIPVAAAAAALVLSLAAPVTAAPDSQHLARAKDYIADERWAQAIDELRAALDDPKEPAPDEAMFWLAHSLYHHGDSASALGTIDRLTSRYPKSRWTSPANALRIEIAYQLRRDDLLWPLAEPPAPPAPPAAPAPPAPPARPAPPASPAPPALPAMPAPPAPPAPPVPPVMSDTDLRIQALGTLMDTDAEKVIPILRKIVMTEGNVAEARRALFVLAQSRRADAQGTLLQVAKDGPERIRAAAVRELGRFGGPDVNQQLLVVYAGGSSPVKQQVVRVLGWRRDAGALEQIVTKESNVVLRDQAILALGRAGGRVQLATLYGKAGSSDLKEQLVTALFNAEADDELIRIAKTDPNESVRTLAIDRLRLLDTDKARAFLKTLK